VRQGRSPRLGLVAVSCQFAQTIFYYPALLAYVGSTLAYIIDPTLASNGIYTAAMIIVDASFVIASRDDRTFDRGLLIGATLPQASSWVDGTIVGVPAGPAVGGSPRTSRVRRDLRRRLPGLLWEESGRRDRLAASVAGGAIALALMPFAPVGPPIVAASAAALLGLRAP
jgi:predicted branched-subunit amino acid permease